MLNMEQFKTTLKDQTELCKIYNAQKALYKLEKNREEKKRAKNAKLYNDTLIK